MVWNEWNAMNNASVNNAQWYQWNTLAHHNVHFADNFADGLKIVHYPNASTSQFRNMQNVSITEGQVWGVQKSVGYFKYDRQGAHVSGMLAPDKCGTLVANSGNLQTDQISDALSFTLYGNSQFSFPASQTGLPYYNNELTCEQPWYLPGTPGGGNPNVGISWTLDHDGLYNFVSKNQFTGDNDTDLFDYMEVMFEELRLDDDSFINTTGVAWWPGDAFSVVQLYRVDRSGNPLYDRPFTIHRDSLFDDNNNLRSFEMNTPEGLYNLSLLVEEDGIHFPIVIEVPQTITHQSTDTKCDRMDITIFPVPIQGNNFTTQVSSDENINFRYRVLDELGTVYFNRGYSIRNDQTHDIFVSTSTDLPNGLIFHTFEVENECLRTITTIKNE